VSDPTLDAARSIVGDHLSTIRGALAGADAGMLNRRPAGDDSNPAAVIVVHALSSARYWLHVATGATPPPRDRDAEFRTTVDGVDELLRFVDEMGSDINAVLDEADAFDPGAHRDVEDVTAAWALVHAVEHLGEHVGHLGLTRQLWDAGTT
jgi:hypothetical protein